MATQSTNPTRSWIRKQPRPATIRATLDTDEERIIDVGDSPKWAQLAQTLDALGWSKLEALDAEGHVLRACEADAEEPTEDEPIDTSMPDIDTGELGKGAGLLALFAKLLYQSQATSAQRSFDFVEVAFRQIVAIVDAQAKRMDAMERVVERVQRRYVRDVEAGDMDAGEGGGGGGDPANLLLQMLHQFAAGQAQGRGAPATGGGHVNGAAKGG